MILAQLDVDDVGTAKVRGFNDALTELGSTLTAFGPRAKALNDVTSNASSLAEAASRVSMAEAALAKQAEAKNAAMQAQAQALANAQAASQKLVETTGKAIAAEAALAVETQKAAEAAKAHTTAVAGAGTAASKAATEIAKVTEATKEEAKATQSATEMVQQAMRARMQAAEAANQMMAKLQQEMQRAAASPGKVGEAIVQQAMDDLAKQTEELQKLAGSLGAAFGDIAPNMTNLSQGLGDLTKRYQDHAKAVSDLTRVSQPNTTITKEQADAYQELAKDMQAFGNVTPEIQKHLDALNQSFKEGGRVDEEMRKHLEGLTQASKDSARSFKEHGSVIPPVTAALKEEAKAAEEAAKKQKELDENTKGLNVGLASLAVVLTTVAAGLATYLQHATDGAAQEERLATAMKAVAENTHQVAGAVEAEVEQIEALGVSGSDATEAVTKFAQANLNVAETSKVAAAAQNLSVIAGKSAADTLQDLTRVIQTQRTEMLKQYGITQTTTMVMKEYGREIGKTRAELTTLDRQQAIINLILTEGAKAAGLYEQALGETATATAELTRVEGDMAQELGKTLLPLKLQFVQTLTEVYRWVTELNPKIRDFAVALGTMVAVFTSLAALYTAGQVTGIFTAIMTFASSGVAAPLLAVAAAITAIGAAIIYTSNSYGRWKEGLEASTNAMVAEHRQVEEMSQALINQEGALIRSESKRKAVLDQIDALNQKIPGAITNIDRETGAYRVNTSVINDNLAAHRKLRQEKLAELRAELQGVESEMALAGRRREAAVADMQRPGAYGAAREAVQAFDDAQGIISEAKKKQLELMAQIEKLDFDAAQRRAVEGARTAAEDMLLSLVPDDKGLKDAYAKIRRLGGEEARKALEMYESGFREISVALTSGGRKKIKQALRPEEYAALAQEMYDAVKAAEEKAEKKAQQIAQSIENARKNIVDAFARDTPAMKGQRLGLKSVFDKIFEEGDLEDYKRALGVFGDELKRLGTVETYAATKGFENLAIALRDVEQIELDQWAEKQREEMEKMASSVSEATFADVMSLTADITAMHYEANRKRIEDEIATAEQIRQINEETYEADVVARMDHDDQVRYQAEKEVAALQRAQDERVRMRQLELADAQRALDEKIRLARLEVDNTIRTARINLQIRQEEKIAEMEMADEATRARIASQQAANMKILADFTTRMAGLRQLRREQIEDERVAGQAVIDARREQYAEEDRALQAALDKRKDSILRNAEYTINAYKMITQAARTIFNGLVTGFAGAYKTILTETHSFKDAMLGVWNSILRALSNIFDQMLERWIGNIQRMATTSEGKFSLSGLLKGIFGGGGGGGGVMATAAGAYGVEGGAGAEGPVIAVDEGGNPIATASNTAGLMAKLKNVKSLSSLFKNYKAGTGFAKTGFGAAAGGAAIGGLTGSLVASQFADGSYARGILSGAASGAATGGAYGGWWGAAGGAIAGGIAGWWQARKQRQQIKKERADFIAQAGGEDAFRVKLEEAGVAQADVDRYMSTKRPKEYAEALKKISEAMTKLEKDQMLVAAGGEEMFRRMAAEAGHFDQATVDAFVNGTLSAEKMQSVFNQMKKDLELKEAKEGLAKTVSQMDALRKQAVLAGYDLRKLYDAKSIEEFNAQQELFNKKLEEQQARLEGLARAAEGFAQRTAGLIQTYRRNLEGFVKGLSAEQQSAWKALADDTEKSGKTVVQRLREAASTATGLAGGARVGDLEITGKQGEELSKVLNKLEGDLARFGGYAGAIFGGIVRETGDIGAAFDAIGEPLDEINKLITETGVQVPEALNKLLSLRSAVQVNEDVVNSLAGIVQMIKGLSDAGQLTEGLFQSLGQDAAAQWQTMKDRGVAEDQALLIMQPTLQALYEAQKNFGFATDEATANLIEMGKQQGIVGDQFQDINSKMLDVLLIIAEAVGGTIPEAYRRQGESAEEAAQKQAAAAEAARIEQERLAKEAADAAVEADKVRNRIDRVDPATLEEAGDKMFFIRDGAQDATDAILRMVDDTAGPLDEMGNRIDRLSLGHSPGGLKEIAIQAVLGERAILHMTNAVDDELLALEDLATNYMTSVEDFIDAIRHTDDEAEAAATDATADALSQMLAQPWQPGGPPSTSAPSPAQLIVNIKAPPVQVQINSVDPSRAAEVWTNYIRPQMMRDLRINNRQIGVQISKAVRTGSGAGAWRTKK